MNLRIREMTRTDLDGVGKILFEAFNYGAYKHGYSPRMRSEQEGKSWAWAMLRHVPREPFVADVDGRLAGICCLNPRGEHAGAGPVAVDPAFQGMGVGRRLMSALLAKAEGLRSVRLFQEAFNPASFSLYYALGFLPVAELLELHLEKGDRKIPERCPCISESGVQNLDAVSIYDMPRSKIDRLTDLAYYVQWGRVFIYRQESRIRGYLACLPGSESVQLGPLVADGEEEAGLLFNHAADVYHGLPCQTRIMARDTHLYKILRNAGFKFTCLNVLMVRGSWRPGVSVEAFGRFPEGT